MATRGKKLIGRLGDVNFPEYDGALVYKTPHGTMVEYVAWDGDDKSAYVGSFDVPAAGAWKDEFWAGDIAGIASSTGESVAQLKAALNSSSALTRAGVLYYSVNGYTRLCRDEMRLSRSEVKKRYARSGPRRSKR